MASKLNAQPNQSLIDGFAIVQALVTADAPIGGRELARQLGFEPTRVNRLLKTLAFIGVARQTADRKYTAGPAMQVMAAHNLFASGLMRNALPLLEDLRRYNLTVALGVMWRFHVSYLYHAPPGISSTEAIGRLSLLPATEVGTGLALLAQEDEDIVREYYAEGPIPGFPDLPALMESLHDIREKNYARILVNPEHEQHTIAVPVGKTAHAAVAFSGWIPEANTEELVTILHSAAEAIDSGKALFEGAETANLVQK